mgnify:CR=1 FL=1
MLEAFNYPIATLREGLNAIYVSPIQWGTIGWV